MIENLLICKEMPHQQKPLIAVCLNKVCQEYPGLCISCFPSHQNHNDDLLTIENIRQKLGEQIYQLKQSYQFCDELNLHINQLKVEINRIILNIQIIQNLSNHQEIIKARELLINYNTMKYDTSIPIKIQKELKKVKDVLTDLKLSIELSQSNLTDGQQQEFQEILKQANSVYTQGKYQEAKDLYVYCLKLDPKNISCRWRIGMCLKMQGTYDQAIQIFDQINLENPNFVESICHKADSLRLQGKYEEALKHFDKTLKLDEKNFVGLSYKGETLRKMQKFEESLLYFEKALMINSKSAVTLFGKGNTVLDYKFK